MSPLPEENADRGPGFYSYSKEQGLQHAPKFVFGLSFELVIEKKDEYSYPVMGWCWFETEEEAKAFFRL